MNVDQHDKLLDYVDTLTQMRSSQFAMGAIRIDAREQKHAQDLLSQRGIGSIETAHLTPGEILQDLFLKLGSQKAISLEINSDFPTELASIVMNISQGVFSANLPGQNELAVINPIKSPAMLILTFIDCEPSDVSLDQATNSLSRI